MVLKIGFYLISVLSTITFIIFMIVDSKENFSISWPNFFENYIKVKNRFNVAKTFPDLKFINYKWILVEYSNEITSELLKMVEMKEWKILLYHTEQINQIDIKAENLVVMNDDLISEVAHRLKINVELFNSRNLAYLLAIANGAKIIVETKGHILPDTSKIFTGSIFTGLCSRDENTFFDPLPHFGQSCAHLLGFAGKHQHFSRQYNVKTIKTPPLQYLIRSKSKDVSYDWNTRLISNAKELDNTAPSVLKPAHALTPFYSNIKIQLYSSFWTMMHPSFFNITSKQSSILFSCIQQKLVDLTGGHVLFSNQILPHETVNANIRPEIAVDNIVGVLSTAKFEKNHWVHCFKEIYKKLFVAEIISADDYERVKHWIRILLALEYQNDDEFPPVESFSNFSTEGIITYFPKELTTVLNGTKEVCIDSETQYKQMSNRTLMKFCVKYGFNVSQNFNKKFPIFSDILLVIVYNSAVTESMYALNLLYRRQFPNLLICGLQETGLKHAENLKISYIASKRLIKDTNANANHSLVTDCLAQAMVLGYNVEGYLLIHDDLMLNYWHFDQPRYDRQKAWSIRNFGLLDAGTNRRTNYNGILRSKFEHWYIVKYQKQMQKVLGEIHNSYKHPSLRRCQENFKNIFRKESLYYYGQSDLMYWPQKFAKDFASVMLQFAKYDIWVELTLLNVMNCIVPLKEQIFVPFGHDYSKHVAVAWKNYSQKLKQHYMHPFKLNSLLDGGDLEKRSVFCDKVVPLVIRH